MIASVAAHAVHHLLSSVTKPAQPSAAGPGVTAPPSGGSAIAGDLGKLSSDILELLGLGSAGEAGAQKGAQAYAAAGSLTK